MAAKRAVAKKREQNVAAPPAAEVQAKPLRPGQCRGYMRRKLAEAFPGIVQGFVDEAKKGSCPHVKLASELLDKPAPKPSRRRKGSAEKMLEKLGIRD